MQQQPHYNRQIRNRTRQRRPQSSRFLAEHHRGKVRTTPSTLPPSRSHQAPNPLRLPQHSPVRPEHRPEPRPEPVEGSCPSARSGDETANNPGELAAKKETPSPLTGEGWDGGDESPLSPRELRPEPVEGLANNTPSPSTGLSKDLSGLGVKILPILYILLVSSTSSTTTSPT